MKTGISTAIVCLCLTAGGTVGYVTSTCAQTAVAARAIGTIETISGGNITLKTDQGVIYTVTTQDGAKVVRIEPGQTSLANAAPITLGDIQVGDRVLASGNAGSAPNTILAMSLVAIKKADVESKQQQDLQAWTRNGTGGLVSAVDVSTGAVTLKVAAAIGSRTVTVQTSKTTQILRYSPGSVKFSDAKPSTLDAVKPGDQLLARGIKSADGGVTADAIVSGAFRNLSGTIASLDASDNTLTLKDASTKMNFVVKVTADSQVRKLAPQAANMLAARMKSTAAEGGTGASGAPGAAGGDRAGGQAGGAQAGGPGGGFGAGGRGFGGGGRGGAGGGDLSQVIARAPAATLMDMQKGDALMIVAMAGTDPSQLTAIQVVAGVEPILQASPTAGMNLPAWNVGGGGGGEE